MCALIWCKLVVWEYHVPTSSSAVVGQLVQRKMAAAAATPSPKLILLGGSSVHQGLSAATIQTELGIPTVNMGTGIPLGLAYILTLGRRVARPGDTVLLSIEYVLYHQGTVSDVMLDHVLARDPEYLAMQPLPKRLSLMLSVSPARLRQGLGLKRSHAVAQLPPPLYTDANGDTTSNREETRNVAAIRSEVSERITELPPDCTGFQEIPAFVRWCQEHQVRVLATFPNTLAFPIYATPEAKRFFQQIRGLYSRLKVPMIGTPEEYIFPEPLFYNSMYHLTTRGVALRTQKTIAELRPFFPSRSQEAVHNPVQ